MLIGIVIGVLSALCLVLIYDKFKTKDKSPDDEMTEDELRKKREEQEHYDNMLNFNATQAYGGNNGK